MKKYLVLSLAIVVMVAAVAVARLTSPSAPSAAVQTAPKSATSASLVDQGKSYLANHNILAARDAFQQAVTADPTDQTAQFFYGVTRVVAVYEDGQNLNTTALDSVRDVLQQCGFVFGTYNVYNTTTTQTPDGIAATTPNTGAVIDFLGTNLLPQIDGAITNLAAVSNTAFTTTLDNAGIGKAAGGTITVDYADVVMLKTLLYGLKCQLKLIQVYGLDFSPPQMANGDPKELMRYRQLLQNDATLLAPKNPSFLADAKAALVSFIDTYGAAIDRIRQRATQTGHLFVLDQPLPGNPIDISSPGVDDFRSALAEVKASLSGPHLFTFANTEDQYRVIDLSRFFNAAAPLNPRQLVVDCGSGVAFPDPTFGGLMPLGIDALSSRFYGYGNDIRGVVCANYTAPRISLSDTSLFFYDNAAAGVNAPASHLSIKNVGTGNLHVASLGRIGTDAASFTLLDETCGGTSPTLTPGQSCSVSVDFAPATTGYKLAAVQVSSDDASDPRVYTRLMGIEEPASGGITLGQYNLNVTLAGSGGGSVTSSTGGVCSSGTCTISSLPEGIPVVLTPVPNASSVFSSWAGCDTVDGDRCSVSMYAARNVTATFTPNPEPLTALASPQGGSYPAIQNVYLAASKPAVIHYTLNGSIPTASSPVYSGPLTVSGPSTTLKYYATAGGTDSAVKTENYTISQYSLTVNRTGTGNGTVNSITAAYPFSCAGSSCSANFPGGAQLTLHATPSAGSLFAGWSGACSGGSDCLLTITGASTATATFNIIPNVRIPLATPVYFATLQAALDAATGSVPIQAVGMEFAENLLLNRDGFVLVLKGGYDSAFSPTSGLTYLDGILTIGKGSLTLENFAIK